MHIEPGLKRGMSRINANILRMLSAARPEEFKGDYLGISHVEGELSYLPTNRETNQPYDDVSKRVSGKPLRILKKFVKETSDPWVTLDNFDITFNNITKDSFVDSYKRGRMMQEITDREWESFLYALKPFIQEVDLQLVDGEEIKYCYLGSNYSQDRTLSTLLNSCMRHSNSQPTIDFYANNKNVKLLVEYDDNKKVRGRALVWTLNNGQVFMDRVYGSEITTEYFHRYAEKHGWFYRTHNTYHSPERVSTPEGRWTTKTMEVELDFFQRMSYLPFRDTFKYIYSHVNDPQRWMTSNVHEYNRRDWIRY